MIRTASEHLVRAPLLDVERALLAPETLDGLAAALPEVASAEEVERRDRGAALFRSARYVARVTPPGFRRLLSGDHLEWVEEVTWDRARHAGRFRILPNLKPERARLFRCGGRYRLEAAAGGTRRVVETEIEIAVRIVGPTVERLVARQLEPHMAREAEVLERVARRGAEVVSER
ncbi:MAG TPA: DUF2505 family protein [Sandaracinaceae bacterium LLY-WYZ-13_1]|nr:DUF2505 family protein [Sandaracinaceae bacterium LLY-WYZ-13_1]